MGIASAAFKGLTSVATGLGGAELSGLGKGGLSGLGKFVGQHPFMAAGSGMGLFYTAKGATHLAEAGVEGATDVLTGRPMRRAENTAQFQRQGRQEDLMLRLQHERELQTMARNAARLAAANPQLYNQIMAGRQLPQGAVVLGGKPRTDLMEELTSSMSRGQYSEPSPDEQLMQLLG